jgi:hypothetical protein
MKMFIGGTIPGLSEAIARILSSDKWHGRKVTIEHVLALVEAAGFTGPRVANHVAWLCKGDPRVEQSGILKLQRETEQQLCQGEGYLIM